SIDSCNVDIFFFSSRRRHTRFSRDWSSDVCSSDLRKRGLGSRVIFECATLEDFNEKDNYDLILSVDVMEHIEEDERVMKNLCDALRKGGMLLISTPSDKGGSDVHHHDSDGAVGFIDEHVRDGYNAADLRQKLQIGRASCRERV